MIIYYSGAGERANPEVSFPPGTACVMISFIDCPKGKPSPRARVLQTVRTGGTVQYGPRLPKRNRKKGDK